MARKRALVDLAGGAAGASMLVLLVYGAELAPWLAIPLAVAAYLGIRRLRPAAETAESDPARERVRAWRALGEARVHLGVIRRLEPRIASPDARQKVRRIADSAERLLTAIQEDEALPAATVFAERIMAPCAALIGEYVRLSRRGVASAGPVIAQTERYDLDLIQQAIDDLYEAIHRQHVIDLAVHSEMIGLNRESIGQSLPRRIGS